MKHWPSRNTKISLYFIMTSIILFGGFYANFWQIANEKWFEKENHYGGSKVVGRLVKSRQDGIFSAGGLPGWGSPDLTPQNDEETYAYQYKAYIEALRFRSFDTYQSQIGGLGILFSLLDKFLYLPPQEKLEIFHACTSMLSALTMALIVLWFSLEFGGLVSFIVFASIVLSPRLVVYGGNLWWSTWPIYLPMVVIMYYLLKKTPTDFKQSTFSVIVFMSVFVKCLFNGYEFITTTLIMMMVPFVYFCIKYRLSLRRFIYGSLNAVFFSFLAIGLSIIILCIQVGSIEGSFSKGVNHIEYALKKRTYADPQSLPPQYTKSLEAKTSDVVITYLRGSYFGPDKYLSISNDTISYVLPRVRYQYLIYIFFIASIFLVAFRNRYKTKEKDDHLALIFTTWFSLLAPVSWFVIFKAHSAKHIIQDYIVWQMPFTIFGFAVCGLFLQAILSWIYTQNNKVQNINQAENGNGTFVKL